MCRACLGIHILVLDWTRSASFSRYSFFYVLISCDILWYDISGSINGTMGGWMMFIYFMIYVTYLILFEILFSNTLINK